MLPQSKEDVLTELARFYDALREAAESGTRPPLPLDEAPTGLHLVVGLVLHSLLVLISRFAALTRLYELMEWAARQRVLNDSLWYEPRACGLSSAYTDLGLALAKLGNLTAAAESLRSAWHVFPCPHSTTYGLPTELAEFLADSGAAEESVEEYFEMNQQFREG